MNKIEETASQEAKHKSSQADQGSGDSAPKLAEEHCQGTMRSGEQQEIPPIDLCVVAQFLGLRITDYRFWLDKILQDSLEAAAQAFPKDKSI